MPYVSEKTKRMNSVRPCDPICKPSSPLDKSTQSGKSLIVSRGNPNLCVFCDQRHAGVSCSTCDPVSTIDSTTDNTPHPRRPPVPSKCKECIVLDEQKSSVILDGVRQTITKKKIKLCATHLQPDTPLPLPEPILDNIPDVSLSVSATEDILQRIEAEDDPLDMLNPITTSSPSSLSTIAATMIIPDPDVPPPPTAPATTPAPDVHPPPPSIAPTCSAGGPIRNRRRKQTGRDQMETLIHENYPVILGEVNSGASINKSLGHAGMSRSSFFKYRYVAEMKIVDAAHYNYLREQFRAADKLSAECKRCVTDEDGDYFQQAQQKRQNKELLPLS